MPDPLIIQELKATCVWILPMSWSSFGIFLKHAISFLNGATYLTSIHFVKTVFFALSLKKLSCKTTFNLTFGFVQFLGFLQKKWFQIQVLKQGFPETTAQFSYYFIYLSLMNGRRSFTYMKEQSNALPALFNSHSHLYRRNIKSMAKSLMALRGDGYFQNCETICTGRRYPWSEIPFNRIGVMIKNDKIKLLEQLYIAALLIDNHGKILWANNFAVNLLGYLYNDYVGHNIQEVRRVTDIIFF